MSKQNTITALDEVRNILTDLLKTEGNNRFMRARLIVSLKMIDAMISMRNTGKYASNSIKKSLHGQKTR